MISSTLKPVAIFLALVLAGGEAVWATWGCPGFLTQEQPESGNIQLELNRGEPIDEVPNSKDEADPVDMARGEFVGEYIDLHIPVRGMEIALMRTYRSQSAYNGPLGYGWDFNYNKRLIELDACNGTNCDMLLRNGDHRLQRFTWDSGSGEYLSEPGVYAKLEALSGGVFRLDWGNGTEWYFDAPGRLLIMRDRNGNQLSFSYSATKQPIVGPSEFATDQQPVELASDYQLTKITDPVGREITLAYNSNGRLDTVTDWDNRTWTYTYDAQGNLERVDFPALSLFPNATQKTTYAYDENHNLTQVWDGKNQNFLEQGYYDSGDEADRIAWQQYGNKRIDLSYDLPGRKTTLTIANIGAVFEWTYDQDGRILIEDHTTESLDAVHHPSATYRQTFDYNSQGEKIEHVFPRGNKITWQYDELNIDPRKRGNLTSVSRHPVTGSGESPITTTYTYTPSAATDLNQLQTVTLPPLISGNPGFEYRYIYDYESPEADGNEGDLVKIEYPEGLAETFEHNAAGQVIKHTDASGMVTEYGHDANGYRNLVVLAKGSVTDEQSTTLVNDARGNVIQITDALSHDTYLEYDELDQLSLMTNHVGAQTYYLYDANGNVERVDRQLTDNGGNPLMRPAASESSNDWLTTRYQYNDLDQVRLVIDDAGKFMRYEYNANNQVDWIEDQSSSDQGRTRLEFAYDSRDLLIKRSKTGDTGEMIFVYDANGNRTEQYDKDSNRTEWIYDGHDRVKEKRYADAAIDTDEAYTYHHNGQLKTVKNGKTPAGFPNFYDYDDLGRLVTLQRRTDNSGTGDLNGFATIGFDYNHPTKPGLLWKITDSEDGSIEYDYDDQNRLDTKIIDLIGLAAQTLDYDYDAVGRLQSLTYPSGSAVSYDYDVLNRLETVRLDGIAVASYAYDVAHRRDSMTLGNGIEVDYVFDQRDRLESVSSSYLGAARHSHAYGYFDDGRVDTMTDGVGVHEYEYHTDEELYQAKHPAGYSYADETFNFDGMGNRETGYSDNELNQYTSQGALSLSYDKNGNLTHDGNNSYRYNSENELERADAGGVTTRYGYDGLGMRVRKDVGGTVTYYIHDGAQVIAEYDGAGNLSAEYLYGPGIDEPLLMERSGNQYYYLADRLGSISGVTDSSGNIVESYEYSAFGEFSKVIGAGNDIGNPYYFTGRRWDDESGTYYYRHRQYDAKLGRFLQRDPLGESSDPNLYRYVYNSPGNATDPMGLVPIWDVIDVAFFAESLGEFKKCRSWGNGINLALDGLGLLPVLPSLGWLRRADDAYDGWKAAKRPSRKLPFKDPERAAEVNKTLDRIQNGGPHPYKQDGSKFRNDQGRLPTEGDYLEYTVDSPGATTRGKRRVVVDQRSGKTYYTDDHYQSFVEIGPAKE